MERMVEHTLAERRLMQQTFEALVQALTEQNQAQRQQTMLMKDMVSIFGEMRDALNDLADAEWLAQKANEEVEFYPEDEDEEPEKPAGRTPQKSRKANSQVANDDDETSKISSFLEKGKKVANGN